MAMIRVYIVDDHPVIRSSVQGLFAGEGDILLCGEAGSCAEALGGIEAAQPDVVMVDMGLPDGSGFDLVRELKAVWPQIRTLVFSMHEETKYALRAIKEGAQGYLMKTAEPEEILDAIRKASEGKKVVSEGLQQQLLSEVTSPVEEEVHPDRVLSSREWQVFERLGEGKTIKEIAEQLAVREKTVRSYCDRIKIKLGQRRLWNVAWLAQEWRRDDPL